MTHCPNCGIAFATPVPLNAGHIYLQQSGNRGSGNKVFKIIAGIGCLVFALPFIAAILFPVFARVREKQQATASVRKLRAIGSAAQAYANDHSGKLPPTDTMDHFQAAVMKYLPAGSGVDAFVEPGANALYWVNPDVSEKKLIQIDRPDATELAEETVPHFGGRRGLVAVLYVDGHVHFEPIGASSQGQ
jgi:prepilin-type processing-associated H-X9-DG protein